jgi:ABC-type phosphonate transport system ATPase subunit
LTDRGRICRCPWGLGHATPVRAGVRIATSAWGNDGVMALDQQRQTGKSRHTYAMAAVSDWMWGSMLDGEGVLKALHARLQVLNLTLLLL